MKENEKGMRLNKTSLLLSFEFNFTAHLVFGTWYFH